MQVVKSDRVDKSSKMDVSTFSATLDSLQQCANSAKPDRKKIRHSLKNLCLYPQSPQLLPPLLTLFHGEVKNQSKCFKFLCYHIITYSRYMGTSPPAAAFVEELSSLAIGFKSPVANMPFILRVFFYICRFCPTFYGILVVTISKVFQHLPDQTVEKGKKGKGRSKAMDELVMACVKEAIDLCIELTSVGDLADQVVAKPKVQARLVAAWPSFPTDTKLQLVRFLGRLKTLPPEYAHLLSRDDPMCQYAFAARFLVSARTEFVSTIDGILDRPACGAVSLMQVTLTRATGATEKVVQSVSRCLAQPSLSTFLPLLELLIVQPLVNLDKSAFIPLYSAAAGSDKLLAFVALMCLSLLMTEPDWICSSFRENLRGVSFTRRSACVQMLIDRWLVAIKNPQVHPMFWKLMELVLTNFSEVLQPVTFVTIVERIIVIGIVDDFVDVATKIVKTRPSTEAITILVHAVGLARGMAGTEAYARFDTAIQKYLEGADPLLLELYEIVLVPE
jgi:hypothetical protein